MPAVALTSPERVLLLVDHLAVSIYPPRSHKIIRHLARKLATGALGMRPLCLWVLSFNNFNFETPETEWLVNYNTNWASIATTDYKQNEWKRVASNS